MDKAWDSMVDGLKHWAEKNGHLAPQGWNTPCTDEQSHPTKGTYRDFTLADQQVVIRAFADGTVEELEGT